MVRIVSTAFRQNGHGEYRVHESRREADAYERYLKSQQDARRWKKRKHKVKRKPTKCKGCGQSLAQKACGRKVRCPACAKERSLAAKRKGPLGV